MPEVFQADHRLAPPRGLVRIYAYYRFLLSVLMLAMYLSEIADGVLGTSSPNIFLITAVSFTVLTVTGLAWLARTAFRSESYLLFGYLFVDIVALNLLMFSSGGLSSGIGLLLLVTIATGSLIFTGQLAIFLAAIASILVMAGTAISVTLLARDDGAFFPAGLLGAVLFFTALLFRNLNRRLVDTQNLAEREADQAAHLQKLNELIVNRMRTGIILVDTNLDIKLINNAAVELLGGHRPGAPLVRGVKLSSVSALFKQYKSWKDYPWVRNPPLWIARSNTQIQCNFARLDEGEERHTIIFIEDTRPTVQSAQQLKLASLGRLAGSIAHEVRNPLGAISHAAQLLAEQGDTSTAIRPLTDIISRHSERVNSIVDSILQLSRQEAPDFQKLYLGQWLAQLSKDYCPTQTSADTNTRIIIIDEIDKNLQVLFDPVHLNQVITNLIENAHRYSKSETGTPWAKLSVHTDRGTGLPCLDIYDRGPGVEDKYQSQIFEPFFTTSNTGTGLGLYLAKERCEFNYATLTYCLTEEKTRLRTAQLINLGAPEDSHQEIRTDTNANPGFFRIIFAHPDQLLPANKP